ncbi:MAG: DTW domain-containing protein, partial [Pseudomonas sp.]|nr:DTW domain-containing protein [Pseudomonas sp.]
MPRPRCERCQRPLDHCLCPLIPALDSRTRVILLQHPSETAHALNTARLAALGLNNAELRVGEVFDDLAEWLAMPGYRPALLFPGDDAQVLTAYGKNDDTPLLLIVPDGTWRKARKVLYMNP